MAKKNDDFFDEKKPWSDVKDELLGCYLKPYVTKILHTHKPLLYVDCFAGKGKFKDGKPGSPIIALDIINECLSNTIVESKHVRANFIDLYYADDLRENIEGYDVSDIIAGKYEDNISGILKDKSGWNVFLYIDPYGIKALQCSLFDSFACGCFNSIELLINMNSFGFIREACHVLGSSFDDTSVFDDLIEYDSTNFDSSEKSVNELNEIAGGDYWQTIIDDYRKQKIDGYEAEVIFSEQYRLRLAQKFVYVLNMPIRIKKGQRPKYRLIHATNHRDGCLLMVDNICNRWQTLQDLQNGGQLQIWEENFENNILDNNEITQNTIDHFSQFSVWTSLYDALAMFFVKYGAICKTGNVKEILNKLEYEGKIKIQRSPDKTKKGTPTTFMSEGKEKKVSLRWVQ